MGKITATLINDFSGGISDDKRVKNNKFCSLVKGFDAFSYGHKLVPQNKFIAAQDKTYEIRNFCYAEYSTGNNRLYGLGLVVGSSAAAVYYWTGSGWAYTTNNESSLGSVDQSVFFFYKGYFYMWGGGNALKRYDATGVAAFNDSYQAISYSSVCQPVVDGKDVAYFFSDNLVHKLNNTSWTGSVLTLPSDEKIVAATMWGNFLAIATSTKTNYAKKSNVYLWDRNAVSWNDCLDYGDGEIYHLSVLDNYLVAVILYNNEIIIKRNNGLFGKETNKIISSGTIDVLPKTRAKINDILYFPLELDVSDVSYSGIYAINSSGKIAISHYIEAADSYESIYDVSGTLWVAHSGDGSVSKQDTVKSSDEPSIYETLIIGDGYNTRKLVSAGILYNPFANAEVTLKYRLKETDDWTTVFTHTTTTEGYHEALNIEATGDQLPEFKEIMFRVESLDGAEITGILYRDEIIPNNLYE